MEDYHIIRNTENLLGKGGFGTVWKAKNVPEDKYVAIKEVQINGQTNKFIEREKRLMNLMKKYEHRNVISFHAAFPVKNVMNFILEYCCHGNLDNFFMEQTHRVSFEQYLLYMENIALGVRHLHEHKICHRDLKPYNILVQCEGDGENYLKVADLGLAHTSTGSSSAAFVTVNTGTAGWQAPEIPRSDSSTHPHRYDLPVDIFSLGLLFLVMLRRSIGKHLEPVRGMSKSDS